MPPLAPGPAVRHGTWGSQEAEQAWCGILALLLRHWVILDKALKLPETQCSPLSNGNDNVDSAEFSKE